MMAWGVMPVKYKLYVKVNFASLGLATGGMRVLASHVTTKGTHQYFSVLYVAGGFLSFWGAYENSIN